MPKYFYMKRGELYVVDNPKEPEIAAIKKRYHYVIDPDFSHVVGYEFNQLKIENGLLMPKEGAVKKDIKAQKIKVTPVVPVVPGLKRVNNAVPPKKKKRKPDYILAAVGVAIGLLLYYSITS